MATTQFAVEYPSADGWKVSIKVREILTDEDPFDLPEEGIEFRRASRSEVGGETDSRVSIGIQRQWPTIDECLVRPQDTRNQLEAIRRMEKVFDNIREGQSQMFVQDLEQCAETVEEFVDLHFAHAEFLFRESVALTGGDDASVIEEGHTVVDHKTIHFARFESVDRSTRGRHEISRYAYFPPTFGVEDLFYYEAFTSAYCKSRESCASLDVTKGQSLAVLGSLELERGKGQRSISGEQVAAEQYFRTKLLPEHGTKFRRFGEAVSLSDNSIAIVDGCTLPACTGTATIYVFSHDTGNGSWVQETKLTATTSEARTYLSSVNIEGNTVAIGGGDGARVFTRSNESGHWDRQVKLTSSGSHVALARDVIVVGAAFEDCLELMALCKGEAYIFHQDSFTGQWTEQEPLKASAPPPPYLFGSSVAFDGATIVIGATGYTMQSGGRWGSYAGTDSGAAYIFTREDTEQGWSTVARLKPDDSSARDEFGRSVAIDGDTLAVGAVGDRSPGAVYVFERDSSSGNWHQKQKLTPDLANETSWLMNHFGAAVAIDGDTLVVGAPYESGLREYSGSVYAFRRDAITGDWKQSIKLKAPDAENQDHFGSSVAIRGATVVAGAPDDSDNGRSSGAAYVFTIPETTTAEH